MKNRTQMKTLGPVGGVTIREANDGWYVGGNDELSAMAEALNRVSAPRAVTKAPLFFVVTVREGWVKIPVEDVAGGWERAQQAAKDILYGVLSS